MIMRIILWITLIIVLMAFSTGLIMEKRIIGKNNRNIYIKFMFIQSGFTVGGPKNFADYLIGAMEEIDRYNSSINCTIITKPYPSIKTLFDDYQCGTFTCYLWCQSSCFVRELFQGLHLNLFQNTSFGPNFSPIYWNSFPIQTSHEGNWSYILNNINGYVVHTDRVMNKLMNNTNTTSKNYIIGRHCYSIKFLEKFFNPNKLVTYKDKIINPNITHFSDREYDLLIYLKFADVNYKKEMEELINRLNETNIYKIRVIRYGQFIQDELIYYASRTKFVIYLSFYDTGSLALAEMSLFGPFLITVDQSIINMPNNGISLNNPLDLNSTISQINDITSIIYDSTKLASINRDYYSPINTVYSVVNTMHFNSVTKLENVKNKKNLINN